MHTVQPARANVLSGIRRHCLSKGEVRHHREAIHPHDDHVAGDDHFTKAVGEGLNHKHGHGEDGLSDAGRHTDADDIGNGRGAGFQVMQRQVEHVPHAQQFPQTEESGNRLRQHGGQRYTGHTHTQAGYKPQIKPYVQRGGNKQKNQCGQAVAHAAQHAGQDIIISKTGNAQEIDHQIIRAPVDDGGGRAEQLEHWAGDKRADDHCNDGYDGGQCDAVANNDGELLTIFCAVTLCYQDAYACGDAHKKRKQKVEYGGGAADGRQRIIADIAAYDDGIRGVVKLLGQIADQHGDSKLKNALPGSAQSHIVRGEKLLQSCSE